MAKLEEIIANIKLPQTPVKVYAFETAVTDIHWDGGGDALKKEYFAKLPELLSKAGVPDQFIQEAPRGGDQRMVDADAFDKTIDIFRQGKRWDGLGTEKELRNEAKRIIFGKPTLHAGGSLANTFDAMVKSTIDGRPIFEGIFRTAAGNDAAGQAFADTFGASGDVLLSPDHKTMLCHVVPIDGDRILIATPNGDKEAQNLITADNMIKEQQIKGIKTADKIMIGGFTCFTPNGFYIYDCLASMFDQTQLRRPEFVMTAANQNVVNQEMVQKQIRKIQRITDTTIHANTGEFRRLLGMDDHWRHFTEGRFENFSGHALEEKKQADSRYKEDKLEANMNAMRHAMQYASHIKADFGRSTQYIVTNGSKATYQIALGHRESLPTDKVAGSKIVSTVGAGDNHMAGYQIGKALGMTNESAMMLANRFAAAVIQSPLARLDENAEVTIGDRVLKGAIAHAFL